MKNFFSYILIGITFLLLVSCSTARNRTLIEPKNKEIKKYIIDKVRTASLYRDYKRVVIMDALYFDWGLRKLFVEDYADSYFEKKDALLKQHRKEYENLYSFFVFVSFQKPRSELQKKNAHWKFFVADNGQGNYYSVEVKKIKKKDIYYFFLEKNFYYYDNWTDIYLVTAAKPSLARAEILKLQLSSLRGKAEVVWKDSIFFEK